MILLFFVVVFVNPYLIASDVSNNLESDVISLDDPDINRNVTELITSKGYPVENHIVQTADGYLLSLQRIPHGKLRRQSVKGKPVLLQHGILGSSADWVLNFPHQSLAYLLADFGYDVWLGNTRGGAYSRSHVNLEPTSSDFWKFSFDQIAEFDLTAMIDYILKKTKEDSLIYIGHSQGTTIAFALLADKPLYNKKIKLLVALAPEIDMGNFKSITGYLVPFHKIIKAALELVGVYELLNKDGPITGNYMQRMCISNSTSSCENFMSLLVGADREQFNHTRMPVYASHFPHGVSTKDLAHFSQIIESKKFRKYDYEEENMKYYNQETPPEYDVSSITTPIALFWGMNDPLSDVEDIYLLEKKLKSTVFSYCVPWKNFNHADFLIAKDARRLVYDEVMSVMKKFKNNKLSAKDIPLQRILCNEEFK